MLKELLAMLSAKKKAAKDLLTKATEEKRLLSEDEKNELEKLKAEIADAKLKVEAFEGLEEDDEPVVASKVKTASAIVEEKAFVPGERAKAEFETIGEFLAAAAYGRDARLTAAQNYNSEQRMDTGSAGGFMVPTKFLSMIKSKDPMAALVRPRATILEAGDQADSAVEIPALDQEPVSGVNRVMAGVEVYKVAEGGTKPTTGFNLKMIKLQPYEIAARIPFTDKLLRNWRVASQYAETLLRKSVGSFEDVQFLLGNGVGGPSGVIPAASTVVVNRAVAAQISFADIKNVYAKFSGNVSNAVWVCSRALFGQLLSMTGDGGGATNIISVDQSTNSIKIYGIPVIVHSRVPGLGIKGDFGIYDFSEYLIKDGSGPIVEVGYATGEWEANKRSIKITHNVDGKSWLTAPYMDEDNYETSSVVVLGDPAIS